MRCYALPETRALVTVEEHNILGGLGEAVAALVSLHHPRPVARVGGAGRVWRVRPGERTA